MEETAPETLNDRLTSSPVLALLDLKNPFFLTNDASDAAVGATLSQQAGNSKSLQIIVCYSQCFTPREQRCPAPEDELYAEW